MEKTLQFRNLRADEIQIRPTDTKTQGSALLLLYQDARCGQNILDDTVGPLNWQKDYKDVKGNVYCGIAIREYDGEWVWKWDCGTESNTEAEKGEASDAFKRACVSWGIGRELYTTPKCRIKCPDSYYWNGKMNMTFSVKTIEYQGKTVTKLVIVDKWGNVVYNYSKDNAVQAAPEAVQTSNERIPSGLYAKVCNAPDIDTLKTLWADNPEYHNNLNFKKLMGNRKAALNAV